ncbi:MAG: hypothetical protein CBD95_005305 [Flavobacteriales bacterium TMED235]|nr:MAG: hypothetical protein CBD95_005305 [Flavobacteriales bacterium TMED235]|tara:strand:+ start:1632 stop:2813 length:1182 start_codon:yes stop_codon:yes gene_type:complete
MKIALIGNMNNNFYSFYRYFNDLKLDVELLIFKNEPKIFNIKNDETRKLKNIKIKKLSWGDRFDLIKTSKIKIYNDLKKYDVLIGCGLSPAFCYKAGLKLDIFVPYGADIYYYTKFNLTYPKNLISLFYTSYYQKKGLKRCKIWHMPLTNDLYEKVYEKYKGHSKRWYEGIPYVYDKAYNNKNLRCKPKKNINKFFKQRKNNKIILFSPSRLVWGRNKNDPNDKGTNILLKGFKIFKEKNSNFSISLILMNYGLDLIKTKKLIKELNLKKDVILIDRQPRNNILYMMKFSDIICCQFKNSWLSYGVIFEALAMSKTIMTFRDDNYYKKKYKVLYPILNANNSVNIYKQLIKFIKYKKKYQKLAKVGRKWYMENCVNKTLEKYSNYFNGIKKNK